MELDEKLENYQNSIEQALAGFLTGKKAREISGNELEQAKNIVVKLPFDRYIELADALDRDDDLAISSIISKYGAKKPEMGESIKPITKSGYVDLDLLLSEGFTYYGVFEDVKLREKVKRYLDENEVEYMEDSEGHIQMKFADRDKAYRAEAAISRVLARNNVSYVRDSAQMQVNEETNKKYIQDGADFYDVRGGHIASAPFEVKDFDMTAAIKAEQWFNEKFLGWVPADDADIDVDFDDSDIEEARKPFPDPGKKYRRFGKPKGLTGAGYHMRKLQKKNGGQGCFTEDKKQGSQTLEEVEEGRKEKAKPSYVRSGGPSQPQSGAGAHGVSTKKGALNKKDPIKGKHKKDLKNLEEKEMDKKVRVEEGVMGMTGIPGLNRMLELAGVRTHKGVTEGFDEMEGMDDMAPNMGDTDLEVVDQEPTGTDIDTYMGDEIEGMDDIAPNMGDTDLEVVDQEPTGTDMDTYMGDEMSPVSVEPNMPVAPAAGLAPMSGDVRNEIETAIGTMISRAPDLKIADYKSVLSQAEDAVAQMRAMGSQYLKEGQKTETLREWVNKQAGLKKIFIKNLIDGRGKK